MADSSCLPLLLLVVVTVLQTVSSLSTELDSSEDSLDQLTARVVELTERLDSWEIQAEQAASQARTLAWQLDQDIPEKQCSLGQVRCGESAQCVGHLLVCDGSADCHNGADEDDCGIPFKEGDLLKPTGVPMPPVNSCTRAYNSRDISFEIKSISSAPGFPQLKTVVVEGRGFRDFGGAIMEVQYFMDGVYDFATKELKDLWTGHGFANRIVIALKFGSGDERVKVEFSRAVSKEVCLGFTLQHVPKQQ